MLSCSDRWVIPGGSVFEVWICQCVVLVTAFEVCCYIPRLVYGRKWLSLLVKIILM